MYIYIYIQSGFYILMVNYVLLKCSRRDFLKKMIDFGVDRDRNFTRQTRQVTNCTKNRTTIYSKFLRRYQIFMVYI